MQCLYSLSIPVLMAVAVFIVNKGAFCIYISLKPLISFALVSVSNSYIMVTSMFKKLGPGYG